jgi:hypothetical protein
MQKPPISDRIKPYLDDPLVNKIRNNDLAELDSPILNEMIASVDLNLRGLKDIYDDGNTNSARHAGHFSSTIMISRGWEFLDHAHSTANVDIIVDRICKNSTTTSTANVYKNIRDKVIPRLINDGSLELSEDYRFVESVMPYPVSSKYHVLKNVLQNSVLLNQQLNQFTIPSRVQYFPQITESLFDRSMRKDFFDRDYNALVSIDVIRPRVIKNRDYTLAKAYFCDDKQIFRWQSVLETSDPIRLGFKELLEAQGEYGGFISQTEIVQMLTTNPRIASRLIRHADQMGLAERTHTLYFEDALSRQISGTKLVLNFHQLKNVGTVLTLCRSIPDAVKMLKSLRVNNEINEIDLISEFDPVDVSKLRNTLIDVGCISKDNCDRDEIWTIVPNKEVEDCLLEIETLLVQSRRITEEGSNINRLDEFFPKDVNDDDIRRELEKIDSEFIDGVGHDL